MRTDYEETLETLALLRIIAAGKKGVADGKGVPAKEAFREARERLKKERGPVLIID